MTFKGKIDKWWYVVIAILNGIAIATVIYSGFSMNIAFSLVLFVIVDLYFIPVMFKNEITINKKSKLLVVQFGVLTKTLPIQEIVRIKEIKTYSASFAASFDRIVIESRRMSTIYVAPQDKEEFTKELMKVNRKIRYMI